MLEQDDSNTDQRAQNNHAFAINQQEDISLAALNSPFEIENEQHATKSSKE